jgi:hypothetical protein
MKYWMFYSYVMKLCYITMFCKIFIKSMTEKLLVSLFQFTNNIFYPVTLVG